MVGISPGYGVGVPEHPRQSLTVWGNGRLDGLVHDTADENGLTSGSIVNVNCSHNSNCEVSASLSQLKAQHGNACNQSHAPFLPGGGGGAPSNVGNPGSPGAPSVVSIQWQLSCVTTSVGTRQCQLQPIITVL